MERSDVSQYLDLLQYQKPLAEHNLSCNNRKCTFGHVHPVKTQISLHICAG